MCDTGERDPTVRADPTFEGRPDLAEIAERVRPIAETTPGLRGISLYGSRARGDFREDSDYDFMAVIDQGHWRDLMVLNGRIEAEFGERASVYDSEEHDDRWRRRIKGDLVSLWGEPVDWPGIVPMTREEAVRDRLAFQLEYIYHSAERVTACDLSSERGRILAECAALRICNTLRNVGRNTPDVYDARFGDVVPDPVANQRILEDEALEGREKHPLILGFIGLLPEIRDRAGEQLDSMGYGRPGDDWTTGLEIRAK